MSGLNKSAVGLGLGVSLLALAGCGGYSNAAAAGLHKGGTAVVALLPQSAPNWFFPIVPNTNYFAANAQAIAMIYKPLVQIGPKDTPVLSQSLAKSITWNKSGTVYTLKLNPKWHWSNGQPVTSKDVVFSWQIAMATSQPNAPWINGGSGIGGIPARIKSIAAKGAYTVVVTLNQPSNQQWFVRNGLGQFFGVAPASVWDRYPKDMTEELNFIHSVASNPTAPEFRVVDGPYRLSKMVPNQYWQFVPNRRYDGHKSLLNKVIFQYETSDQTEFAALKSGTVSVGYMPFSMWASRNALTSDTLKPLFRLGFNYVQLNLSPKAEGGIGSVFQQLPVRQALQYGINEVQINKTFYHGLGAVENSPIAAEPKTPFYDPRLSKLTYPFDIAKGKAVLLKNGWQLKHGVMIKNGRKLAFTLDYTTGSSTLESIVQVLQQNWKSEGIDVQLNALAPNSLFSIMSPATAQKWQAAIWDGGWGYKPDYYPSGGGLFATGSGSNFGSYSNANMNALIKASYAPAATPQAAYASLGRYLAYASRQLPATLWMPWTPVLFVHAKALHGSVQHANMIDNIYEPNYWWVSQ